MLSNIITFVLGYTIASFVLTALFVRLEKKTALAVKVRRHFYCFPLLPAFLIFRSILQGMTWTLHTVGEFLRYCFETLSGNKTYRRLKSDRYYRD